MEISVALLLLLAFNDKCLGNDGSHMINIPSDAKVSIKLTRNLRILSIKVGVNGSDFEKDIMAERHSLLLGISQGRPLNFTSTQGWSRSQVLQHIRQARSNTEDLQIRIQPYQARLSFFVAIISSRTAISRRELLRSTWITRMQDTVNLSYRFFVGKGKGTKDDRLENDVVVLGSPDTYKAMPHKVLAMVRWAVENQMLPNPDTLLFKIDDDAYLNIPNLLELHLSNLSTYRLYAGKRLVGGKPVRDPMHKYHLSMEAWPLEEFPEYAMGGGYLISRDLANGLAQAMGRREAIHPEACGNLNESPASTEVYSDAGIDATNKAKSVFPCAVGSLEDLSMGVWLAQLFPGITVTDVCAFGNGVCGVVKTAPSNGLRIRQRMRLDRDKVAMVLNVEDPKKYHTIHRWLRDEASKTQKSSDRYLFITFDVMHQCEDGTCAKMLACDWRRSDCDVVVL